MKTLRYFTASVFVVLLVSCNGNDIVGTWRPDDLPKYPSHGRTYNDSLGDLVISSDSTFLFKGYQAVDTMSGFFGGGGSFRGFWTRPDKNHIVLLPENVDKKFSAVFSFKILVLDRQKLIFRGMNTPDTIKLRTFLRQ